MGTLLAAKVTREAQQLLAHALCGPAHAQRLCEEGSGHLQLAAKCTGRTMHLVCSSCCSFVPTPQWLETRGIHMENHALQIELV